MSCIEYHASGYGIRIPTVDELTAAHKQKVVNFIIDHADTVNKNFSEWLGPVLANPTQPVLDSIDLDYGHIYEPVSAIFTSETNVHLDIVMDSYRNTLYLILGDTSPWLLTKAEKALTHDDAERLFSALVADLALEDLQQDESLPGDILAIAVG